MSIFLENLQINPQVIQVGDRVLKIQGPDARSYLNSQTTNNLDFLTDQSFQINSILDVTGKIITTFLLSQNDRQSYYVITDKANVNACFDRLEKFHISEDFEIEILEEDSFICTRPKNRSGYRGSYFFNNDCLIIGGALTPSLKTNEENLLRIFTGVHRQGIEVDAGILINNTVFDDLAVDYKKGCFPGQETVSKINSRRGAATKPVWAKLENNDLELSKGEKILVNDKKIGTVISAEKYEGSWYLNIDLLRQYRIDNSNLNVFISGKEISLEVNYLPVFKKDPKETAVELYDHGISLFHEGKSEEAISYFQSAIKFNPSFEDAYEGLGVIYGRREDLDLAIQTFEQLKEINSKCMMAYTNLSLYHMKKGEIEKAEDYKSQATLLNFEILGDEAEKKRKEEEVKKRKLAEMEKRKGMFLQVLELDPEDAMANNGMGEILYEEQDYSNSENYFRAALTTNEKYSVAYLGLGKSYIAQGKNTEAIETFRKGIQVAGINGDLMPANSMQALLSGLIS